MKILILLYLAGHMLTINPPIDIIPEINGVMAQVPFDETTLVYAHASMAGGYAYDLEISDHVIGVFSDGTSQEYEVTQIGSYVAQSTDIARTGGDIELYVDNVRTHVSDIIRTYSSHDSITLFTCWPRNTQVTGRMFVELVPTESKQQ